MIFFIANHASVLIGFLASLIVPTLFRPADFGFYALALTIATVATPLGTAKADMVVLRSDDDQAASRAFTVGIGHLAVTSVVYALVLAGCWAGGADSTVLLFLPVYTGVGLAALMRASVVKRGHHRVAAGMTIGQSLGMAVAQLCFGWAGLGLLGLLLGDVLARLAVYGACARWCHPLTITGCTLRLDRPRLRLAGVAGLNALNVNYLQVIAVPVFGSTQAGQLALAQRFGNGLQMLIGLPATQAFQASLAAVPGVGDRARTALALVRRWALAAAAATTGCALLVVGAIPVLAHWYGSAWAGMVPLSWSVIPLMALQALVSPLTQTYLLMGEEHTQLRWDAARSAMLLGLLAAAMAMPLPWFLALYAMALTVLLTAFATAVLRFLRRRAAHDA